MLYDSGTPSLLTYTRDLAGDPDSAASEIWSEARVKAAINDAYLEMRETARMFHTGPEVKRAYADTVANQLWYELPADFKRMVMVEVESSGVNLSTTKGNPTVLEPLALQVALDGYQTGAFTALKYVAMGDGHFAVIGPVTTAGTKSLRITYEAETDALSNDTDEPADIPEPHQYLICYKAAVSLRASENLEHDNLLRLTLQKERSFRIAMQERYNSDDDQMAVAGLTDQKHLTQFGRMPK